MGARMIQAVRRRDALEALVALADSVRGQPFEWGRTDCGALFLRALACIDEHGQRYLDLITWSSAWGAFKALRELTPAALVEQIGAVPVSMLEVAGGDLVLGWVEDTTTPPGGLPVCGVGVGSMFLSSRSETGVLLMPRSLVIDNADQLTGWRIE